MAEQVRTLRLNFGQLAAVMKLPSACNACNGLQDCTVAGLRQLHDCTKETFAMAVITASLMSLFKFFLEQCKFVLIIIIITVSY